MASSVALQNLCVPSITYPKTLTLTLIPSQFLSSKSVLKLKRQILTAHPISRQSRSLSAIRAEKSSFFKAIQTAWNIAKNGVEAGTDMVPVSVPRPIARISVTFAALSVFLFVLKSFLSTAYFVLVTMGLVYFIYIALNKDQGTKQGGDGRDPTSTEDALEEAKRIMDKYK